MINIKSNYGSKISLDTLQVPGWTRLVHGTVFAVAFVDISVGLESDAMVVFASVDVSVGVESDAMVDFASVFVSVVVFPSFERISKLNNN